MKKIYLLLLLFSLQLFSQNDSIKKWNFSGYGEIYYSYDFSEPANHEKADYIYNHKRHNELNANLLLVKANYSEEKLRANLGVMLGNYPHYNLSAEPDWAQFIYEANIGFKISKTKNLWLDVGVLPSHIGFESAVGADNFTLTRSLIAENSPYFETGARLSYQNPSENLYLAFLVLNGWQKIQKPDGIQNPSFGAQITFKPNEKISLNYSNFFGSDTPDADKNFRTYHNLYAQISPNSKLAIIAGIDLGTENQNAETKTWLAAALISKIKLNEKSDIAFRAERFLDKNQIMISSNSAKGFKMFGFSANYDYKISEKILLRFEGKNYNSAHQLFENQSKNNWFATTSLAIKL